MPVSFSLRHVYLGTQTEPRTRMLRTPPDLYVVRSSRASRYTAETDCSGRSLATLLVAWVSAAMVASVLLRWKYMWIALAVLTLLFLIACGYAACTTRRNIENDILRTEANYLEQRRQMEVQSVSGNLSTCPNRNEPPAYQTYWITDLPPPYAVVVDGDEVPQQQSQTGEQRVHPLGPGLSNPPPYSIAVQQDHVIAPSLEQSLTTANLQVNNTNDLSSNVLNMNDNKDNVESRNETSPNVLTSGTQYLSNLISNTFSRSPRSRNEQIPSQPSQRDDNHVRNQVAPDTSLGSS